jgi:CHAT domain-containing protein/tetratricopeptide (TPR) repeat protein
LPVKKVFLIVLFFISIRASHLFCLTIPDEAIKHANSAMQLLDFHAGSNNLNSAIFNNFLVNADLLEASTYLLSIPSSDKFYPLAQWMLAKIFILQNSPERAAISFKNAIFAATPSLFLLDDFAQFESNTDDVLSNGRNIIFSSAIPTELKSAFSILLQRHTFQYQTAIDEYEQLPDSLRPQPVMLLEIGECYLMTNRLDKAMSLFRAGVVKSRMRNDSFYLLLFQNKIAQCLGWKTEYERMGALIDTIFISAVNHGDMYNLQQAYFSRALMHFEKGEYGEAVRDYDQAIQLAQKLRAYDILAFSYLQCGNVYFQLGKYTQALDCFRQGEQTALSISHKHLVLKNKMRQADVYAYIQQPVMAKKLFQDCKAIISDNNWTIEEESLKWRLLDLVVSSGEKYDIHKMLASYMKIKQEFLSLIERSTVNREIGMLHARLKDYETAKSYYRKAYNLAVMGKSHYYAAWYLDNIATMETYQGHFQKATDLLLQAIKLAEKENSPLLTRWLLISLGKTLRESGDLVEAIEKFKKAVEIIEEDRKSLKAQDLRIGFLAGPLTAYQNLAQCYFELYETESKRAYLDSLFYYAEMCRARVLKDLRIHTNHKSISDSMTSVSNLYLESCNRLRKLQRRLRQNPDVKSTSDDLDNTISELEVDKLDLISQRLELKNVEQESASDSLRTLGLDEVIHTSKEHNCGVLFYNIMDSGAFVVIVGRDSTDAMRLAIKSNVLRSKVDSLVSPFHNVGQTDIHETPFRARIAHELYQVLFEPIEEKMPLPEQLFIVPDVAIMNLPFELLLRQEPAQATYLPTDLPEYAENFLLHDYRFCYGPTAAILKEKRDFSNKKKKVLVFANPFAPHDKEIDKEVLFRYRMGWQFSPLYYAKDEAKNIKKYYSSTKIFTSAEASEQRFIKRAKDYSVLHIASHAYVDNSFDAFSGLILAPTVDSTDDGILMGFEINDLEFPCDLITLSACETGRGKKIAGEGVLGLPRLFIGAGANTVLMTLWKVDDKFTAELMPEFYDLYLNKKFSKAHALQRSKSRLVHEELPFKNVYYQHPFFWASFVMYGNPGFAKTASNAEKRHPLKKYFYGVMLLFVVGLAFFVLRYFVAARRRRISIS